jgi:hypothetical protein
MGFLETDTEVYCWFLGRRYGSVKLEDLIGLIEKGLIRPDTKIEINGMIVEASRIKCLKPHFSLDEVEEPTVIETEPYIYGKDDFTDNVVEFDVSEPNAVMYLDGDGARVVIEPSVIE